MAGTKSELRNAKTPRKTSSVGSSTGYTAKKQSSLLNFFTKSNKAPTIPADNRKSSFPSPSSSPSREISATAKTSFDEDKENAEPTQSTTAVAIPARADIDDNKENNEINTKSAMPITPINAGSSVDREPLNQSSSVNSSSSPAPRLESREQPPSSPSKRQRKRPNYAELSDDEDFTLRLKNNRKRTHVVLDDASEDEFVPDPKIDQSDDDDLDDDFVVPDDFEEDKVQSDNDEDDDDFIDITKRKKSSSVSKPPQPSKKETKLSSRFSASADYKPSPFSQKKSPITTKQPLKQSKSEKFTKTNEERYQWLVDIRDSEKRTESDPEYDPRTLYIPQSAWSKFTSFEKQYWEIKSKMWDCIVFFKKGKFYELYEKDAMIAHNEFDLKIAGGGRANMQLAGIPEMSFDYWACSFIAKGYKVAKVDQIETGLAKEIRENGAPKKGKKDVIQRKLKCVLTAGTLTEESMLSDDMATYCLAVKEDVDPEDVSSKIFGVAFIDTSTGSIQMTEFKDDSECSKLETLVSQLRPKEVIACKNNLCQLANRILRFNSQSKAIFNIIKPDTEFYDFDTTFETLARAKYFEADNLDDLSHWPSTLREFYEQNKMVGFSAFGGLLWYLRSLKLDESLISLGNVQHYTTIKPLTNLVLDGQTLQNLEIFANSFDGTDKGTLFKLINRATTAFGKRLLKTWVVHPLLQKHDINNRLDTVDLLLENGELKSIIELYLSKLPDLERLLSRVHAGQLKIKDFTRVIEGFEDIAALYNKLGSFELKGTLQKVFSSFPSGLEDALSKWSDAFDRIQSRDHGVLLLSKGVDEDFDNSQKGLEELEDALAVKLRQYRRELKCQSIEYKDFGKELYTIEVPVSIKVPNTWKQMGASKKTKRYWSPEVEELSKEIARAKELHKTLEETLKVRMYKRFDTDYDIWVKAIDAIAIIDSLVSLARTSESIGYPAARPEFVDSETGHLEFRELRHPCFNLGVSKSQEFIPNDITLGGNSPNLGLLTGANAAGKSTVLRMTCIAVILAQIGCYTPCEYAKLAPVDRIMTRLGANDNIMQGKSTFYVELSETKRILENATPKSLLVLDELGRGGSSSDGFAIAEAVLHHIATHIQSLGFFATHYGSLGQSFKSHPQVKPFRMAILVDESSKNITFLYKLEEGAAEGSFGMHVAAMCGIAKDIVQSSEIAAQEFEHTSRLKKNDKIFTDLIPLGLQSDFARLLKGGFTNKEDGVGEGALVYNELIQKNALESICQMIDGL